MSAEDQDVTMEETEAPEAAVQEAADPAAQVEPETPEAEAADAEPVAEVAVEAEAEEPVEEPGAEELPADEEPADVEPVAEEDEPATVAEAFGPVRVARVYVCERGHRTTTLWGTPETCQARPLRSGPECGLTLYHITELPEQVQKALNPLKASKKGSKKK